MTSGAEKENAVIDAALRLAARRRWRDVRLGDVAAEADVDLADLAEVASSKADIVRRFSRRTDRALLASLKTQPAEGDPHDRLFEVVMRRLEILTPHRAALASILEAPAGHPTGMAMLASSAATTQRWMLTAAGLEEEGAGGLVKQGGLACVYARTLNVWLNDDDPGLARTMSTLDGDLRNGARWLRFAEVPITLATALSGIARGLWRGRQPRRDAGYAPPQSPPPPEPGPPSGEPPSGGTGA